jgi:bacterioferritin-associated ferredoxin
MSPVCQPAPKLICHCLQVTEDDLLSAVARGQLRTVQEIAQATGAGDGCTACHRRIVQYLRQQACRS